MGFLAKAFHAMANCSAMASFEKASPPLCTAAATFSLNAVSAAALLSMRRSMYVT